MQLENERLGEQLQEKEVYLATMASLSMEAIQCIITRLEIIRLSQPLT